ncbi:MAG: aminoacyl-tRNA hydrolase [cyanobacterium endosymbiont of Rhopalodia musculus]|uniref:aminoacyl-tRNA hydrolase n=1 Tax=cyanobacterium endosymbiont of Epithemia clementina EcSB TaxID=3034674 RepID=UPI002480EE78|nr:aminoacyl-tRNA hydrolase [cyanobacterium endosymbiont of Epithemia clementina EcSB]WGT67542.1 aminoacyl-tRNA hydrolase [cyanobacterium endosymbiont of Epithemia clementina EcSB]
MSKSLLSSLIIPQLIIGLGNCEAKYDKTRHNIGFEALDALAQTWKLSFTENRRFQGLFSEGIVKGNQKVYLLKPLTYMNLSGQSVRAVSDWYKLSLASILVIYDDMDLPVGRIRIRLGGSAGGHNGMKSVIAYLGSQNFPRLRIGIGESHSSKETISHVLGKFSSDEKNVIKNVFPLVVNALDMSLKEGVEKAMSIYNNRTIIK